MNINNYYNLKRFDNYKFPNYNKFVCSFGNEQKDSFILKETRPLMDIQEEMEKLNKSKFLNDSIVAFIPPLVRAYFEGKLNQTDFSKKYSVEMGKAMLYLSQLQPDLIRDNQEAFKNEFAFADGINELIKNASGKNQFDKDLSELIIKYNKNYQDSCGK
ncbi:hypothetical protein II906_03320 [bacterium]|nr:hypothetical protein [bacterium]